MREYEVLNIKKIKFIDGGAFGEFYKLHGVKYYSVTLDIVHEDRELKRELFDLLFYFSQNDLDKLLSSKKINYDREKHEFEMI
ncbi:hypothetical protein EJM73_06470 [Clostridium botulinum]|uniref:hypothetical protein n=1 Tax=Clostridium botulinum TaxID=1491 RepID=UPI001375F56B|nr:hypothetical protein [Clostridium botulinum]NCI20601.1 hypothetical protein [Clostridium botulinum]NCI35310.1 hypothetical protein [Clostridium botulinum]NCI72098.1 hypothetical protein [Clostridium botulinum]NDI38211.1 hypothetical protein [Clostridium botulinum]